MTRPAKIVIALLGFLLGLDTSWGARTIPRPLPSHPGNIFLRGEEMIVPVAEPGTNATWRALDYDGKTVAEGQFEKGKARLGTLPVGYYELTWGQGLTNRVSLGVIEGLKAPTPVTSPICIDVAMAWFFPKEKMAAPASLCALAGINRVRDRLSWPEIEPKRGEFAVHTRYDDSAAAQVAAGLQILQVDHISPPWANPNPKRFPLDLRDAYNFYREIARRWNGQVLAFEPWNEADIEVFGGHTGSEMASMQKASYLGLKAGNSNVIACQNVFAIHRAATLRNFNENEAWPYFDKFNLHHYEPLNEYPKLYADFRAMSGGRPLWVTECSVRVKWSGDEKLRELSREDLRLQSERLTKTYVLGLHQGAEEIFYFMLPHYTEGALQYGLLRADLSPRPGYIALAAVGRLLADARPIGRLPLPRGGGQAYFFDAKPDGKPADVVVAWGPGEASVELPEVPQAVYDHLGRAVAVSGKALKIGTAPVYAILPRKLDRKLAAPPKPARVLPGKAGPVVLQALFPEKDVLVKQSAYRFTPGQDCRVPLFLYNFSEKRARGTLSVTGPEGWRLSLASEAEIAPGERKELLLEIGCGSSDDATGGAVRITGDFGSGGKPVLVLRLLGGAANSL